MPARAAELRDLITDLGPAFVKVGQACSIRPDLLPEAYLAELRALQDSVAPAGRSEIYRILEQSLGRPPAEVRLVKCGR